MKAWHKQNSFKPHILNCYKIGSFKCAYDKIKHVKRSTVLLFHLRWLATAVPTVR